MIDESEVLTPADEEHHILEGRIRKLRLSTEPRRSLARHCAGSEEGYAMIRTKGEPGTGNVSEAVTHIRMVNSELRRVKSIYQDGGTQELDEGRHAN